MSVLSIIIVFVLSPPVSVFFGPISVITGPGIVGLTTFGSARVAYGISRSPGP